MRTALYVLSVLEISILLIWMPGTAFGQPEFIFPSDGPEQEGLPTEFTIEVSNVAFLQVYDIELCLEKSFDPNLGYPNYQNKRINFSRVLSVDGLSTGEKYYIRTRSRFFFGGSWSFYRLDSITTDTVPFLTYVVNIANNSYLQNPDNDFETLFKSGATRYRWEFNTEPDFSGTGENRLRFTTTTNQTTLNWSDLQSGTLYYVRTRARINNTWGPWTNILDPSKVISFYSPIHLQSIWAPGAMAVLDRTRFKVWVEPIPGATEYSFQISDDPGFGNIIDEQLSNKHWKNDAMFNGFDSTAEYFVYDYFGREVDLMRDTDYWIRVRGSNANQAGNYGPSIQINTGLQVSFVENIPDGTMGTEVNLLLDFQVVPTASTYSLQLSTTSDFSSGVTEYTNLATNVFVGGLMYNTTYYSRVRVDSDPWGDVIVSWTTKAEPVTVITHPNEGQTIGPNTQMLSTPQGGATYEWEVDTQSDFSSGGKLTANTNDPRVQFIDMLSYSTTYYIRVRALIASQSITGPWSTTVMFNIVDPPPGMNDDSQIQSQDGGIAIGNVYPNPFVNSFNVSLRGEEQRVSLLLYNNYGEVVYSIENQSMEQIEQLEMGNGLPQGLYLLRIIDSKNNLKNAIRLVKE